MSLIDRSSPRSIDLYQVRLESGTNDKHRRITEDDLVFILFVTERPPLIYRSSSNFPALARRLQSETAEFTGRLTEGDLLMAIFVLCVDNHRCQIFKSFASAGSTRSNDLVALASFCSDTDVFDWSHFPCHWSHFPCLGFATDLSGYSTIAKGSKSHAIKV